MLYQITVIDGHLTVAAFSFVSFVGVISYKNTLQYKKEGKWVYNE